MADALLLGLAGLNKTVQSQYWKLFQERGWDKYRIPLTIKGADSILEFPVVNDHDFRDLGILTQQIELGAVVFIRDVEKFLVGI
jgi:hypothetical protein